MDLMEHKKKMHILLRIENVGMDKKKGTLYYNGFYYIRATRCVFNHFSGHFVVNIFINFGRVTSVVYDFCPFVECYKIARASGNLSAQIFFVAEDKPERYHFIFCLSFNLLTALWFHITLRMSVPRIFTTKSLIRTEFQYLAIQHNFKKINLIKDVKSIYFRQCNK